MGGLVVYVDTNALITMDQTAGRISSPHLMGSMLSPEFDVRVTSTVVGEMQPNRNPIGSEWLAEQVLAGNVTLRDTSEIPAGVRGNGERSIVYDIQTSGGTSQVVVVTDDRRAINMINREFPAGNVDTMSLQGLVESSLFTGGTSYVDYINIAFQNGWNPIGMSDLRTQVTNGATVEATPEGLLITSPTGVTTLVSATDRFRLSETGEVEILGSGIGDQCFLGDTPIQMWPLDPSIKPRADGSYDEAFVLSKVWEKPISEIKVGDIVVAYDDRGRLGPKRVLRTMENRATHILDFWGTGTTPGHAYHCADGPNKGGHAPIMDILRMDGAIMRADGTMIRAATNCKVGSMGDMMIHASATLQKPDGSWTEPKAGKVRFGTRIILPDDRHMSFMEMAASEGWRVSDDGYMVGMMKGEDGELQEQKFLFPYAHGEELPKPEAYILARSAVTLEEIYAAGEWEQIGTRLPAPAGMFGLNTNHTSTLLQPSKPQPNMPPAFANRPDAQYRMHNAPRGLP